MRIKNWEKFQHFKNRKPPWIKLYRDILDQVDIVSLSDKAFRVLIGLWVLAAEDPKQKGNLPDIKTICFRLRLQEATVTKALGELISYVYQDDIKMISTRHQLGSPETETKKEKEAETKKEKEGEEKQSIGEYENVKLSKKQYDKLCNDLGKDTVDVYVKKLDDWIEETGKGKNFKHKITIRKWHTSDVNTGKFRKELDRNEGLKQWAKAQGL